MEHLELTNCSFAYGNGEFRLDSVSLRVQPGMMYGIVGPNGSGKSTLLRIMAGIARPFPGEVSIGGKSLARFSRLALARKLAFLPQHPTPSYDLTVREVVALGRYPHQSGFGLLSSRDHQVIAKSLEDTECEKLANRFLSTLSGGERQRVMIASILAQEPDILLLDEPGSALDIHHKTHVFDLLWQLSRHHIGVVMVTHDLNLAAEFCDELLLLDNGQTEKIGSPAVVMTDTRLSKVYKADLRVSSHPLTNFPMVSVASRKKTLQPPACPGR